MPGSGALAFLYRTPVFADDEEKTRVGRSMSFILSAYSVILLVTLIMELAAPTSPNSKPMLSASLGLLVIMRWLVWRGHLSLSAILLCVFQLLITTLALYSQGTIRAPIAMSYAVIIAFASLYVGKWATTATLIVSSILIAVLIVAENQGLLPPATHAVGITQWANMTMYMAIAALLVHITMRDVKDALQRARKEIEERKRVEHELAQHQAQLETLVEKRTAQIITLEQRLEYLLATNPAVIFAYDPPPKNQFTFVSSNILQLLGYTSEQFTGNARFLVEKTHPNDRPSLEASIQPLLETGKITQTYRVRHADGSYRWLLSDARVQYEAEGKSQEIIGYWADVTEQKLLEQDLEMAKNEAEAANRAKSTFLANMGHELRTPLTVIISYSEMLLLSQDQGKASERVQHILDSSKLLLGIINNVLDYSRIEAGGITFAPEKIDLPLLVMELTSNVRPLMDKNHNVLLVDSVIENAGSIFADRIRLKQILSNLIDNAAKFTQNGRVNISVQRLAAPQGDQVVFEITDTGIGIPSDQLETIFEPFMQVDSSTTRKYSGSGLGLPISNRLCEMMGGKISVQSELDKGSTFTVRLPAGQ